MRFAFFLLLAGFLIGCEGEGEQPDTRECPFCLEEVKVGAFKCKHCGEDPYKGNDKERALENALNRFDERGISTTSENSLISIIKEDWVGLLAGIGFLAIFYWISRAVES